MSDPVTPDTPVPTPDPDYPDDFETLPHEDELLEAMMADMRRALTDPATEEADRG